MIKSTLGELIGKYDTIVNISPTSFPRVTTKKKPRKKTKRPEYDELRLSCLMTIRGQEMINWLKFKLDRHRNPWKKEIYGKCVYCCKKLPGWKYLKTEDLYRCHYCHTHLLPIPLAELFDYPDVGRQTPRSYIARIWITRK
jgi:hypothetical protein